MTKRQSFTFKVVDIHDPSIIYGDLTLTGHGSKREWAFKLSEDITPESWRAFGLFPADMGSASDSSYLEELLIKRVPLKQRIQKDFEKHATEKILDIISNSGLQVASDSYKLVPA